MRVIAGAARGRTLFGPRTDATRPTSDLARGAMFSMIEHLLPDYERVLDLYAGTGALGIEALSRGATHCDFVDDNRTACATIRRNLETTRLEGGFVHCIPVQAALDRLNGAYDLVLLDPPYATADLVPTIEAILSRGLLQERGLLVAEHSRRTDLPDTIGALSQIRDRRHGDTMIAIYVHSSTVDGEDDVDE